MDQKTLLPDTSLACVGRPTSMTRACGTPHCGQKELGMFEQILDPTGHVWLSVLLSLVPLIALLFMLAALRMTAWLASILVGIVTIPIGVYVWHAPLAGTLKSYLYGGLTGFWVIDWITFWGLIIFNTLVLTGHFERFKNWMIHHAT